MLDLIEIDIKKFKKEIYPEYKSLFPAVERKPYFVLKKSFKNNYTKFVEIINDKLTVGFFILFFIDSNIQVDYFGIFKKHQSHGYGSEALNMLKEKYEKYSMFVEVEKADCGESEEENKTRKRRIDFYEKNGFKSINFSFSLFNVIYTPYCFNYEIPNDLNEAINIYLSFYYAIYSKKKFNKHLKVLDNEKAN